MLVGLDGNPLPPSDVVERLKNVDPALGLRYVHNMKMWAITWRWTLSDPRREMIQRGDMNPDDAFDVFAWLPEDCPPEQAFGYIERGFVRNGGRHEVQYLLSRLDRYNQKLFDDKLQETNDLAEELLAANAKTLFGGKSQHVGPRSKKDKKAFEEFLRSQ